MTPIPTNKGLLIPVVVPVDATKIDIHPAGSNPTPHPAALWWSVNNTSQMEYITDGESHSLIGTLIYKDGEYITDFDPGPFVETQPSEGYVYDGPTFFQIYRNYNEREEYWKLKCDQYTSAHESFISLLQSYSIGWVNPLGEKAPLYPHEPTFTAGWGEEEFEMALRGYKRDRREYDAWQEAESRKLSVDQMVVLIQVK